MVDLDQFLGPEGIRIRFGRVAEVGVGAIFGAVFTGLASVVLALADVPIALLGGLADFFGEVVAIVVGLPAVIVRQGFLAAIPFVLDAGIAGYLVAISISLLTLYVAAEVVSRVR